MGGRIPLIVQVAYFQSCRA